MTYSPQGIFVCGGIIGFRGENGVTATFFLVQCRGCRSNNQNAEENRVMHRMLHMEPSLCTGCLQCEMACSYEHEGEFNPARSRIRVFEFEHGRTSVPVSYTHLTLPTKA